MSPDPHLAIVDPQTGELRAAGCAECAEFAAKLAGREADFDALVAEHTRVLRQRDTLLRNRDQERRQDPQRALVLEVFEHWQKRCAHPNARFDGRRFDLIKGRLRQFSVAELKMAIDGAAVDAYVDSKGKRHDRLGLIFESAERVEDFANRWHRWQKRQPGDEVPR
jgi:hypothetical protein